MSRTACASCPDPHRARRRLAACLGALLCAGCAAPPPAPPAPGAKTLFEERFPNRARTVRSDDGGWLLPWLVHYWAADVELPALETELAAQRKAGYSIEDALVAVLPAAGVWPHASYGNWNELRDRLAAGCPVIVQLPSGDGRTRTRRFAALAEADARTGVLRGYAAGGAPWEMAKSDFLAAWAQLRNWMFTACPPERVAWRMRGVEYVSLIRYLDHMGQSEKAEAIAARALAQEPDNPDLLVSLGTRAHARGRAADAERHFREALARDDRQVRAANNLAFLLGEQDRNLDEALSLARRAVILEPGNPQALDTQGYLLMKAGRWPEARAALERAWQRAHAMPGPARLEIGRRLARVYRHTGSTHLAEALEDELRGIDPTPRPVDDGLAPELESP